MRRWGMLQGLPENIAAVRGANPKERGEKQDGTDTKGKHIEVRKAGG
jgi:hypothetical protein